MKALLVFTLFILTTFLHAQNIQKDESLIRFKPNPGDFLRITLTDKETETAAPNTVPDADRNERLKASSALRQQSVTDKEIGYDWKIQERDADGNTVITTSFAYIRVVQTFGKQIRVNEGQGEVVNEGAELVLDTRQDIMISNPILKELNKMPHDQQPKTIVQSIAILEKALEILNHSLIGRSFTMVISPGGKLLEVRDMNLVMDQYRDEIGKIKTEFIERAKLDAWIESFFGEDNVSKTMRMILLLPYPEPTTQPGETWSDKIEFDISGLKIVMTRQLRLNEVKTDGKILLSGAAKMKFQKDGILFDPPEADLSLNADFDLTTGMYDRYQSEGDMKFTARAKEVAPGADSVLYLDQQLYLKAVVTKVAHWDSLDKKFWVFEEPGMRYRLRLAAGWTPEIRDNTLNPSRSILKNIQLYDQPLTQATLTSSAWPISKEDKQQDLSGKAQELKAMFEKDGKTKAAISLNKVFNTGSVRWQRCRIEIKEATGEQRTYWSQSGYGTNKYTFELIFPGPPSVETEREASEMFDRIETQENYWPGFQQSDLIGEWTSNLKTENSVTPIKYIFQKDGSVLWLIDDPAFKHDWPSGIRGKYILRGNSLKWELDIYNFADARLKGITFQCILNPVGKRKLRMEGGPTRAGQGERPKSFSEEAIILSKIK